MARFDHLGYFLQQSMNICQDCSWILKILKNTPTTSKNIFSIKMLLKSSIRQKMHNCLSRQKNWQNNKQTCEKFHNKLSNYTLLPKYFNKRKQQSKKLEITLLLVLAWRQRICCLWSWPGEPWHSVPEWVQPWPPHSEFYHPKFPTLPLQPQSQVPVFSF